MRHETETLTVHDRRRMHSFQYGIHPVLAEERKYDGGGDAHANTNADVFNIAPSQTPDTCDL